MCSYPPLRADRIALPLTVVGGCALLALGVGLVGRWGPVVQLALMLALGSYAAYLGDETAFDRAAPFVAAALVLAGELAYTSLEPPARRTWPFTSAMVAAAALLAALLLGAAGAGGGELRDLVLGVVAAAGALALVARLAVSRRSSES